MKKVIVLVILFVTVMIFINESCTAQIVNVKEVVKQKGTERVNSWIENGVDAGFDKIEEEAKEAVTGEDDAEEENDEADASGEEETNNSEAEESRESNGKKQEATITRQTAGSQEKQKLESFTQYDFVPGDRILYFEDFSQDAIGDFPALWTSNGSGEVKNVNVASGKWLHLNGEDAVYCFSKNISFPDNFIVEFDIIPDGEYSDGIIFTLYQENQDDPQELNDALYPGKAGVHIFVKKEGWETLGYTESPDDPWLNGQAAKNPVSQEEVNHVIIWVQKRRVRIYHQGAKTLDVPTNIYPGVALDRIRFSGWDRNSWPLITNIRITSAAPDTRSKLITEGKLTTYGITFDVNKAVIKPESYGTLNDIANVLKENPGVRVKIVGHTDSDGDDAMNLDLSKKRAESVKNELATKFGIEASRIQTDGAGESQPVAPNNSASNKAMNRRVEFIKL